MSAFVKVTAVVLIVIAIGVSMVGGFTSALGPTRSYGMYPFRFSVAFPVYEEGHLQVYTPATPDFVAYSFVANDFVALVAGARLDTRTGSQLVHGLFAYDLRGYRTQTISADGTTATLAYPTCATIKQPYEHAYAPGFCSDVEIMRDGEVTWLVTVAARHAPAVAQAFVASGVMYRFEDDGPDLRANNLVGTPDIFLDAIFSHSPGGYATTSDGSRERTVRSISLYLRGAVILTATGLPGNDCWGILYIAARQAKPVLGESGPGSYYFVRRNTSSASCDAQTVKPSVIGASSRPSP